MLFTILKFFIGGSDLGDDTVQAIGEKIDNFKESESQKREDQKKKEWNQEKAKIQADHERIKQKWSN